MGEGAGPGASKRGGQAASKAGDSSVPGAGRSGWMLRGPEMGPVGFCAVGREPRAGRGPPPSPGLALQAGHALQLSHALSSDTSLPWSACGLASQLAHSEDRAIKTRPSRTLGPAAGSWHKATGLPPSSPGQPRLRSVDTADRRMDG